MEINIFDQIFIQIFIQNIVVYTTKGVNKYINSDAYTCQQIIQTLKFAYVFTEGIITL